ncbi:hypothetical protein CR513_51455, partial [Mucuna pruriens]
MVYTEIKGKKGFLKSRKGKLCVFGKEIFLWFEIIHKIMHKRFYAFMISHNFLYVNNLTIVFTLKAKIKTMLSNDFKMKNSGAIKMIVGDEILEKQDLMSTNEKKNYMSKIPYSSVVESLMYVIVCIRPYFAPCINVVSIFKSNIGKAH